MKYAKILLRLKNEGELNYSTIPKTRPDITVELMILPSKTFNLALIPNYLMYLNF